MREPPVSVREALEEGRRRSLDASTTRLLPTPAQLFWRRHKWKLIGLVLFLLFDLVMAGGLFNGHF